MPNVVWNARWLSGERIGVPMSGVTAPAPDACAAETVVAVLS